ncbi:uncharacterized protein LOC113271924 [Papaver somniferum]|uniref:uncharacterized protein LOC113271924 n=1 Tax=Papaver somniferum TaxID=3469 RepID=UPI000E7016EF|nr:uncharacterized protein LOC113271924 [Papaver somniferum]
MKLVNGRFIVLDYPMGKHLNANQVISFTHVSLYMGLNHPLANTRWVAKVMLECYKAHPNYKPRDFITEVKKNHKVDISYFTAWHAFHLFNEKIMGSYEEGYSLLPVLCDQIKGENSRNIVKFKTDLVTGGFVSLCIAYRVSLDEFAKNRPILGLDGCHLNGKYGGTLLEITSLDGNNDLFPIAIYICQSECKESWIDFLSIMAEELKHHPMALTFISDRKKGLIEGVSRNFIDVNHSHRLKEAKPSAPEWFDREPVETWERCYFDREQVGKKMPDGGVVPRVTNTIKKYLYFSHEFSKQPSTVHLWSVSDTKKDISWVVNLEEHTCTCNAWQVCVISCVHGICASLYHRTKNHDKYVHEYMFVDTYRKIYAPFIEPLLGKALWAVVTILNNVVVHLNPREVNLLNALGHQVDLEVKEEGTEMRVTIIGNICAGNVMSPSTFTGPHVRPNPALSPPPPPPATA